MIAQEFSCNPNTYFLQINAVYKRYCFSVSKVQKNPEAIDSTACINCKKYSDKSFEKKLYQLPQYVGLFFNTEGVWAQHLSLRKGLSFAVNKNNLLKGNSGWDEISSLFFFSGVQGKTVSDSDAARSILVDGGFKWDSKIENRKRDNQPVSVRFIVPTLPPVLSRFAQKIEKEWEEKIGIEIDLQILSKDDFLVALSQRDYDVVLSGMDFSGVANMSAIWHSEQSGKFNFSNLTNETVDSLVREFQVFGAESDLYLLNEKLNELSVALPLFTPKYEWFVSKTLKGVAQNFRKLPHHSDRFWGVESWYFDEKKSWDIPNDTSMIGTFFQFLFRVDAR